MKCLDEEFFLHFRESNGNMTSAGQTLQQKAETSHTELLAIHSVMESFLATKPEAGATGLGVDMEQEQYIPPL